MKLEITIADHGTLRACRIGLAEVRGNYDEPRFCACLDRIHAELTLALRLAQEQAEFDAGLTAVLGGAVTVPVMEVQA